MSASQEPRAVAGLPAWRDGSWQYRAGAVSCAVRYDAPADRTTPPMVPHRADKSNPWPFWRFPDLVSGVSTLVAPGERVIRPWDCVDLYVPGLGHERHGDKHAGRGSAPSTPPWREKRRMGWRPGFPLRRQSPGSLFDWPKWEHPLWLATCSHSVRLGLLCDAGGIRRGASRQHAHRPRAWEGRAPSAGLTRARRAGYSPACARPRLCPPHVTDQQSATPAGERLMTAPQLSASNANTEFYQERLPNGLQIVGQRMPDLESVSVCFFARTGARDEHDPAIYGVSHFLEHMVFKGTAAPRHRADHARLQPHGRRVQRLHLGRADRLLRAHPAASICPTRSTCSAT